jgi:hypothetical protein
MANVIVEKRLTGAFNVLSEYQRYGKDKSMLTIDSYNNIGVVASCLIEMSTSDKYIGRIN